MGFARPPPSTPPLYLQPKKETPKLESAFELFPRGVENHSDRWKAALTIGKVDRPDDLTCPGKDTVDTKCTCPDFMYATKIRIMYGTYTSRFYCGCCDLPLAGPLR